MAKTEETSWSTESGLLDDFDFVVEEAWFGADEENDDERIFLFLRGAAVDNEGEEHEDHQERYSTGKDWEVVEDGEEVENVAGRTKFNQNGGIGRLINALVALGEDEAKYLQDRGHPTEAATFVGLKMHLLSGIVSEWKITEGPDEGKMAKWYLNLPTSLNIKTKKKAAKRKPAAKGGASTKLRKSVIEFASEFDENEHDEFVDQVLDDSVFDDADNIESDEELHAEVLDPDSKLWATAHK